MGPEGFEPPSAGFSGHQPEGLNAPPLEPAILPGYTMTPYTGVARNCL